MLSTYYEYGVGPRRAGAGADRTAIDATAWCSEMPAVGRVEYAKVRDGHWARVIADFSADGNEDFSEQEQNDVRWRPYRPSEGERSFAFRLLTHCTEQH